MIPTVSVVMNTYNDDHVHLDHAIQSVLNQENVIIDLVICSVEGDCNTERLAKYPCRVIYIPKKEHVGRGPRGCYQQINYALKYCIGEWFTFISGNDTMHPYKCITEVSVCQSAGAKVCYSAYNMCRGNMDYIETIYFGPYNWAEHVRGNFVSDASMIRMEVLKELLPFREDQGNFAFWDLWLRLAITERDGDNSHYFVYNPTPTWNYRQNRGSMHSQRKKNIYTKMEYQQEKERFIQQYKGKR
jgi:glycosyltransferase involved in cell wall biosynthesis